MENLQARIREIRALQLQTEMNLARQPYPEEDSQGSQDEANVVSLPDRPKSPEAEPEVAPAPRTTKRKAGSAAKRKSATVPNQPPFIPFRQLREGSQHPFADELKRLEAQAERINQLLAERARQQVAQEQSVPPAENTRSMPEAKQTSPIASKKSAKSAQRIPPSANLEEQPMFALDDDSDDLEAQADRIHQLLAELEAALLQQATASPNAPPEQPPIQSPPWAAPVHPQPPVSGSTEPLPAPQANTSPSSTYRYRTEIPTFAVGQAQPSPETDDRQASLAAAETAQALRYLTSRERVTPANAQPPGYEPRRPVAPPYPPRTAKPSSRSPYLRLKQLLQIPQKPMDRLGDAVLWTVLAIVVRVGTRFLVAQVPILSPLFILLQFAPAALAVYLALFVPKAGFVSVYRLFLIMLGLFLGDRFF